MGEATEGRKFNEKTASSGIGVMIVGLGWLVLNERR